MTAQRVDPLDLAFAACHRSCQPETMRLLRITVEPLLVARLAMLSNDGEVIQAAIDDALALFDPKALDEREINWRAWLVSTALASLAERLGQTTWLDRHIPTAFPGTAAEKRSLLIGVILTLDSECQWRLLQCLSGRPALLFMANDCLRKLERRLQKLTAAGQTPPL